jgi:hypothetical protein
MTIVTLDPLRPHDLRHTAVAFWIATGANPLEVSRRAGHSSTSLTLDRYGHLFPQAATRSPTASTPSRRTHVASNCERRSVARSSTVLKILLAFCSRIRSERTPEPPRPL